MNNTLKILVVLPLYGGSLPIGRFCSAALQELGHNVETFEAPDFYPSYTAIQNLKVTTDRLDYLQNTYLQMVSQAVQAKVETFEPDLVLAMAQAPMTHQTLKRLKRDNVPTAMWFVEDYSLFTYWKSYAPFYDIFAVIQKGPFTRELNAIGVDNVLYLPLAAQPDFHRPLELSPIDRKKYGSDISFMGAGYPNRRVAFQKLVGKNFKIWGNEWDGDHVLKPLLQFDGRRVSSEECVKIFNATSINLNLHSSIQADQLVTHGDFINPRTFELCGCGAFQLVDKRQLMDEAFDSDELATFESMDDLMDKVDYFLAHPEECRAYAEKGKARVLREHTYAARMQSLLDFTAQRLEGWPGEREKTDLYSEDFPPELRKDIAALLEQLKLPEDVSFEDLVWAIRRQEGTLSELDTSILFLDEWRKMYGKLS